MLTSRNAADGMDVCAGLDVELQYYPAGPGTSTKGPCAPVLRYFEMCFYLSFDLRFTVLVEIFVAAVSAARNRQHG